MASPVRRAANRHIDTAQERLRNASPEPLSPSLRFSPARAPVPYHDHAFSATLSPRNLALGPPASPVRSGPPQRLFSPPKFRAPLSPRLGGELALQTVTPSPPRAIQPEFGRRDLLTAKGPCGDDAVLPRSPHPTQREEPKLGAAQLALRSLAIESKSARKQRRQLESQREAAALTVAQLVDERDQVSAAVACLRKEAGVDLERAMGQLHAQARDRQELRGALGARLEAEQLVKHERQRQDAVHQAWQSSLELEKGRLAELSTRLQQQAVRQTDRTRHLSRLHQDHAQQAVELCRLQQQVQDTERSNEATRLAIQALQDEQRGRCDEAQLLEEELAALAEQARACEHELETTDQQLQDHQSSQVPLDFALNEARLELRRSEQLALDLRAKCQAGEQERARLARDLQKAEAEQAALAHERDQLRPMADQLHQQVEEARALNAQRLQQGQEADRERQQQYRATAQAAAEAVQERDLLQRQVGQLECERGAVEGERHQLQQHGEHLKLQELQRIEQAQGVLRREKELLADAQRRETEAQEVASALQGAVLDAEAVQVTLQGTLQQQKSLEQELEAARQKLQQQERAVWRVDADIRAAYALLAADQQQGSLKLEELQRASHVGKGEAQHLADKLQRDLEDQKMDLQALDEQCYAATQAIGASELSGNEAWDRLERSRLALQATKEQTAAAEKQLLDVEERMRKSVQRQEILGKDLGLRRDELVREAEHLEQLHLASDRETVRKKQLIDEVQTTRYERQRELSARLSDLAQEQRRQEQSSEDQKQAWEQDLMALAEEVAALEARKGDLEVSLQAASEAQQEACKSVVLAAQESPVRSRSASPARPEVLSPREDLVAGAQENAQLAAENARAFKELQLTEAVLNDLRRKIAGQE